MGNKKAKFLFYISCFLLCLAIGLFFGDYLRIHLVHVSTVETNISDASLQNKDMLSADDIFETYTQTSLKSDFKSAEKITTLYEQGRIDQKIFDRAKEVLQGNVKYSYQREFSTTFDDAHKIAQAGNLYTYSSSTLKFNFPTCEFNLTGIYGLTGQTIRVFVDAKENENLPQIVFTQNHGYYTSNSWKRQKQLQLGMNEFIYDDFVSSSSYISQNERKGGAIYICNPFTADEQGDVSVYIEGGGYYPIFRKGDDNKQFLSTLTEYYEQYRTSTTMLDMAELVTDHALFTTTAESLYKVYVENNEISPSENMQLWGNYMNEVFKFNGIADNEQNKNIVINFRYMSTYKNSGAYTYFNHIGFYEEHYWFANFNNIRNSKYNLTDHLIFGIGHELGHMIDIDGRRINETTNNFTAAIAYYKILGMSQQNHSPLGYEQYAPFDKTLNNIASDYTLAYQAYHDGKIMYTSDYVNGSGSTLKADHNYLIWWDLECAFPGYWGRLNNLYQSKDLVNLSNLEQMVYYSSIATKVDLSYYFERWGFYWSSEYYTDLANRFTYEKSSTEFKRLMSQAESDGKITKTNAPYWYVDTLQYDFMQKNQNVPEDEKKYDNLKPRITKITQSGKERTVFIYSEKNANHLGYQVWSKTQNSDWKVAGFTYSSNFVDKTSYSSLPTYKVVAINRFFYSSRESDEQSNITQESESVCRLDGQLYSSLKDAIGQATTGQTIYLLADCSLGGTTQLYKELTIAVDPSVNTDIVITASNSFIQMNGNMSFIGRENAKIIIDGRLIENANPVIYNSSGTFVARYVTFQNLKTKILAGVIYGMDDVELYNCVFDNCKNLKSIATIHANKNLKMEDCVFVNIQDTCVEISDISNLTLSNKINNFTITFEDFLGERNINLIGQFTQEVIEKISVKSGYLLTYENNNLQVNPESYILKFYINGMGYEKKISSPEFEFGTEGYNYQLSENQYVKYIERQGENIYYLGDKINLSGNMEFDVEIKSKTKLTTYYNGNVDINFYPEEMGIYLPIIDPAKQKVVAYLDGNLIYYAGQIYIRDKESSLVAIYEGNFVYRYIVRDEIYSVNYGKYNDEIVLPDIKEDGFQGWQYGGEIISDTFVLQGDTDLIAVFGDAPQIYDLTQCEILVDGNYIYSGENITPKIIVYFNDLIVPANCYSVSYSNNKFASNNAQVTISFVDGLSIGSKSQTFTINPKQLEKNDIKVTGLQNFVYNGSQTEQNLIITYKDEQISSFSIEYIGNRVNAGDVQVKISFFGNYTGDIRFEYTIFKAERKNFKVLLDDWVYGHREASPQVENVEEQSEVSYSYSTAENGNFVSNKPKNAGTYWIKAEIKQSTNYNSAEAKARFIIAKADHPEPMPNTEMMVGRKIETLRDVHLIEGWQWANLDGKIDEETIKAWAIYSDRENYEIYQIEITLTKEAPKDVSQLSVYIEIKSFIYNGEAKTPEVIAKDGGLTLTLGVDFDVRYENNKFAGQGKAIVTFKNDYKGTKEISFKISQAEKPNVSSKTIRFNHKATKLSDIPLPSGYIWENNDLEITSNRMRAKAIYVGDDADNYITKEIYFEIIIDWQQEPEPGKLIWLAIVPVVALLVWFVVFIIIKCKKSKWRKN